MENIYLARPKISDPLYIKTEECITESLQLVNLPQFQSKLFHYLQSINLIFLFHRRVFIAPNLLESIYILFSISQKISTANQYIIYILLMIFREFPMNYS